MAKQRLDSALAEKGLVTTRSQAENFIKLGKVKVDGRVITRPGFFVSDENIVEISDEERYVSRAGLKLASIAQNLKLDFKDKVVLDVGSSTGGFTDYALKHGAKKVIAVDVGTDQMHPSLRKDPRIELYEQTDIRNVIANELTGPVAAPRDATRHINVVAGPAIIELAPDIILIDVSFISLREILPHIADNLANENTQIVAMLKPQFEAGKDQSSKGIIKNNSIRRQIFRDFEEWARKLFVVLDKRDSDVAGEKGNQERFYLLTLKRNSTTSPGRIV